MAANGVMRVEPTVSKANQCTTKDRYEYSTVLYCTTCIASIIPFPLPNSGIRREQTKTDQTLCTFCGLVVRQGAGCRLLWGCQLGLCSCQIHVSVVPWRRPLLETPQKNSQERQKKSQKRRPWMTLTAVAKLPGASAVLICIASHVYVQQSTHGTGYLYRTCAVL